MLQMRIRDVRDNGTPNQYDGFSRCLAVHLDRRVDPPPEGALPEPGGLDITPHSSALMPGPPPGLRSSPGPLPHYGDQGMAVPFWVPVNSVNGSSQSRGRSPALSASSAAIAAWYRPERSGVTAFSHRLVSPAVSKL